MKKFLEILKLIPMIVELIQMAEATIPGAVQGKAKLDMVTNLVLAGLQAVPGIQLDLSSNDIVSLVARIASTTVLTANAANTFNHSK